MCTRWLKGSILLPPRRHASEPWTALALAAKRRDTPEHTHLLTRARSCSLTPLPRLRGLDRPARARELLAQGDLGSTQLTLRLTTTAVVRITVVEPQRGSEAGEAHTSSATTTRLPSSPTATPSTSRTSPRSSTSPLATSTTSRTSRWAPARVLLWHSALRAAALLRAASWALAQVLAWALCATRRGR